MALNRKTFKKAAAGAAADTNLPSGYFNTVLYEGNGSTQRIGGYINRGGVFNGSSSKIAVPSTNTTPIDFSTENWSISWWIYLNTLADNKQMIGKWGASPGVVFLFRTKSNGQIELYERDGITSFLETTSAGTIAAGQWYNMTYSRSATEAKFYLNGSLNKTMSRTNAINQGGTEPINIGGNGSSGIDGKIDQVRIFDKAISSSEVTTLYGETHASTTKSTTDIFDDNSGVALYQLDGNANDTGGVSGYIGEGAIFSGSSASTGSRISLSNNVYGSSTTVFSASLWVKCTNTAGEIPIIGNGSTIGGTTGYVVYINSGSLTLSFANGSSYDFFYGQSINDNNWHHIVITYNNGAYVLYLDNSVELNGTSSIFLNNATPTYDTFLGNRWARTQDTSNSVLNGAIDQVRIYSKALSSSEVSTLYGETASSNITISDLVAYYPMEGTSLDQEGSYHGTDSNVEYNYNGTATNVTYQEATNFSPDLIWFKNRDEAENHVLFDSIRGATNFIQSNTTIAEETNVTTLTSFDSNGFTVSNDEKVNKNSIDYVSWCFNAGTDAAASNTDGSITSTVKANTDAGFSIVEYTGSGVAATIGHGLSAAPEFIICKQTSSSAVGKNWVVYANPLGNTKGLLLNATSAAFTDGDAWNNTTPNASVFSVGAGYDAYGTQTNVSGSTNIAYCFHSVDEIQKVGSYTGTGAAGNIVETGFEPAFLMLKRTDSANDWNIFDNKRSTANPRNDVIRANLSNAEGVDDSFLIVDFLSNGFVLKGTSGGTNISGGDYIYLAIAADPDTTTPTVEDSFEVVTYTGTGSTQEIDTGFKPDFVWVKSRSATWEHFLQDSIRGAGNYLRSNSTGAAGTTSPNIVSSFDTNGFTVLGNGNSNNNNDTYVAWCWKAGDHDDNLPQINTEGTIDSVVSVNDAAGFSIVKYTGNGNNSATVGHGLSSAPEMIIVKDTSAGNHWAVVHTSCTITGTTTIVDPEYKMLRLDSTDAEYDYQNLVVSPAQSSTTFTLGNQVNVNGLNNTYIAYCFTSITGYQKLGSYSGTGSAGQTITTGFQPRFVMIKATNNASDWYLIDSVRPNNKFLIANGSNSEFTASDTHTFTSTGFTLSGSSYNNSGYDWIYLAIK